LDTTTQKALFAAFFKSAESPCVSAKDFDAIDGKPFTGCSEVNLIVNTQGACEANRRVAVLLVKVSKNFPVTYPCKQGDLIPCQNQAKLQGVRRTTGFRCKFYDGLVDENGTQRPRQDQHEEVIEYEPSLSTVRGKIIKKTFEIECDDGHDICIDGSDVRWFLCLNEPVSVPVRSDDSLHYPPVNEIREIQVNHSTMNGKSLSEGAEVILKGYLSHGHSPFHHCPIQLALVEIVSPVSGDGNA
jgi:hypothetical protein